MRESCTLPFFLPQSAVLCIDHRRQKGASARLVLKRMTVQAGAATTRQCPQKCQTDDGLRGGPK